MNSNAPYWQSQQSFNHWLPHLWLPVLVFVLLFVFIKIPSRLFTPGKTLQVSLQTPQPKTKPIEDLLAPKETGPSIVDEQVEIRKPTQPASIQTNQDMPKPNIITAQPKVTISATDLMQQAKNHTNVHITDEFTARTTEYTPQETPWKTFPTSEDPYGDIPYLATYDLAIKMDFYSQGYRGDIERFFDKVILKKTFTTKYGTKINCALAVIVVCSWK